MLRIPKEGDWVVTTSPNVWNARLQEHFPLGTLLRVEKVWWMDEIGGGLCFKLEYGLHEVILGPHNRVEGCYPFALTQYIENN